MSCEVLIHSLGRSEPRSGSIAHSPIQIAKTCSHLVIYPLFLQISATAYGYRLVQEDLANLDYMKCRLTWASTLQCCCIFVPAPRANKDSVACPRMFPNRRTEK